MKKRKYIVLVLFISCCVFISLKYRNDFTLEQKVFADFDAYLKQPSVKISAFTNFDWDYFIFILSDPYANEDYFFVKSGQVVYQNPDRYDNIEGENNRHRLEFQVDERLAAKDWSKFYQLKKYEHALICNSKAVITLVNTHDEGLRDLQFLPDIKNCHVVKSPFVFKEYGVLE